MKRITEDDASESSRSDDTSLAGTSTAMTERSPLLPKTFLGRVRRLFFCKKPLAASPDDYIPHARLDIGDGIHWGDLKNKPDELSKIIVKDLYSSAEDLLAQLRSWAIRERFDGILKRKDVDPLIHLTSTGRHILRSCNVYTAYD